MQNNVKCSIGQYLETLEDTTLYTKKSCIECFECIKSQFDSDKCDVTKAEVLRILTVFIKCLKEDKQCLPQAISTVSSLLSNLRITPILHEQDLLPSAVSLLQLLNTLCESSESVNLREMSFDLFFKYPPDVIVALVTNNSAEILQMFEIFKPTIEQTRVEKELMVFLQKLLQILPAESKKLFLIEGLEVWFSHIVPIVMYVVVQNGFKHKVLFVECLETLTDALIPVDYFHCKQWIFVIMDSICDSNKYTSIMKNQLQSGSDVWHRLWIIFVKLLKNNITQAHTIKKNVTVTPINLMLPVVEAAFKMDTVNRCRAFQCWDSLIDNFSSEPNEKCLPKRIKLVMIPLKLNNAKTEETAVAKFNTWWHLIVKFEHRLDKFPNDILIAFINFAFGKAASERKSAAFGVGEYYRNVSLQCLQAFVQIVGHGDCDCCSNFPKLHGKIMNVKLLANNWADWIFALKEAVKLAFQIYKDNIKENTIVVPKPVLCIWKAFVHTVAELPPNGVRRDMFDGLIEVVMELAQVCKTNKYLSDILFSMTISLFGDDEEKIKLVLLTANGEKPPLEKVITMMTLPDMLDVYERFETETIVGMIKPFTNITVEAKLIDLLLNNLSKLPTHCSLKLWTALVHSTLETKTDVNPKKVCKLLMWPVKSVHQMSEDKYAAMAWCTMYNLIFDVKNVLKTGLENSVLLDCIMTPHKDESRYFKFCLTVCLLKSKLVRQEDTGLIPEVLKNLIPEMGDYSSFKEAVPLLIDTIVVMLNNVVGSKNVPLAEKSLTCVKYALNTIIKEIKSNSDEASNPIDANIFIILNNLFNAVGPIFQVPFYSDYCCDFLDYLTQQGLQINKDSSLFKFVVNQMKSFLLNSIEPVKIKINDSIKVLHSELSEDVNRNAFTSPDVTKVVKRVKKKETSIVSTVVENGEEYMVVQSHWKFNPRKLTENQKEKFQRKREDIPALYQDLSQSQDEFKLATWKIDSQDTSSNSKSTTNDDALVINSVDTVKSNNDKNLLPATTTSIIKDSGCNLKYDTPKKVNRVSLSTPKNVRSPRMALKDRVFQNVRNLIKTSMPNNDTTEKNAVPQTVTISKTPQTKPNKNSIVINSAPTLLSADRPSRMKRTPKKFDDAQLFGLKKRRISHSERRSESPTDDCIIVSHQFNSDNLNNTVQKNDKANEPIKPMPMDEEPRSQSHKENDHAVVSIPTSSAEHSSSNQVVIELNPSATISSDATKDILNKPISEDIILEKNTDNVSQIAKNDDVQNKLDDDVLDSHRNDSLHKVNTNENTQESQTTSNNPESQEIPAQEKVSDGNGNIMIEINTENVKTNENKADELNTPAKTSKETPQKLNTKRAAKRSRIEKELAIDMVEGHPYLQVQSEKRLTRKKIANVETNRRKTLFEKLHKEHPEPKVSPKVNKKVKSDKLTLNSQESSSGIVDETHKKVKADQSLLLGNHSTALTLRKTQQRMSPVQNSTTSNEDAPCSEDVIESSQDSTFTTISVKCTKHTPKRLPVIAIERINILSNSNYTSTQELLEESDCEILESAEDKAYANKENKDDDIELPQNKTAEVEKNQSDLTENMDTEPIPDNSIANDVIVIDDVLPITINSENSVGIETQELAEAETQPNNPADFAEFESAITQSPKHVQSLNTSINTEENIPITVNTPVSTLDIREDNVIVSENNKTFDISCQKDTDMSSPFKDDAQRKEDFLNNTSEISPIKIQSPDREKSSPTKETSTDYMVVKLTSPVQSNGEPFDKSDSPEFFTGEKVSPDKRDLSPPRVEVSVNSGSPSSSLSLKKNRPQALRPSGRAAHMLGLCVPDSLNTIKNQERVELEEPKKVNTSTPARRNLRVLYNADNGDGLSENDQEDQFLRFKKDLPLTDSSPSVPILKRKLIDIVDETTASPANKKKRVSFHDPPVSTTVSVQKYIEPGCIKSPSSAHKRLERQMMRTYSKSPKRLENTFLKLDTVLSNAVESFTDEQPDSLTNDTSMSLDVTPAVEVVITSELNDTDPICPNLVDCIDSIKNIALELSSPAMKDLLIKELEGKVTTIGDLAKMSELDVNRLCIKAPKVQIAKKVLTDYANKQVVAVPQEIPDTVILTDDTALAVEMTEEMTESEVKTLCIGTQTDAVKVADIRVQTRTEIVKLASTQTTIENLDTSAQTIESGSKTTSEIISTSMAERDDFIDRLNEQLEEASRRKISENLPIETIIDVLTNKSDDSTPKLVLSKMFDSLNQNVSSEEGRLKELSILNDYLYERFDNRNLILFCSQLLQKVYDKPA